eukprot:9660051-Alexandrium_andersonii.AAC.1
MNELCKVYDASVDAHWFLDPVERNQLSLAVARFHPQRFLIAIPLRFAIAIIFPLAIAIADNPAII